MVTSTRESSHTHVIPSCMVFANHQAIEFALKGDRSIMCSFLSGQMREGGDAKLYDRYTSIWKRGTVNQ